MSLHRPQIRSDDDPDLILSALTEGDLPLIGRWLAEPHVARWWDPPETGIAHIAAHMTEAHVAPYLIVAPGRPVGYLQLYHANPDEFWRPRRLPRETYGLDLFIGPSEALGRGLGTRAVRLSVRHLSALPEAARLHVDPSPDNAVAIRVYDKAGFVGAGAIETPDGPAAYMIREPQRAILSAPRAKESR